MPYKHLGANDEREIIPDEAPPMIVGLQGFGVATSILYTVRTLQISKLRFSFLFEQDDLLIDLRTLGMWEERIMEMIGEVQKACKNSES